MISLANIDPAQGEIARHLATTEKLLARAVYQISRGSSGAQIVLLPDLGLPYSVTRMHGGFYTGMLAKWDCTEPFVPVDCTVNVCAVSIFRVADGTELQNNFAGLISKAYKTTLRDSSYIWNFDKGNHFITLASVGIEQELPAGDYLVLHSSACEFKSQHNGLYPTRDNWYSHQIEAVYDRPSGRYLRFLRGRIAEQFYARAHHLVEYNRLRLQYFADLIAGPNSCEEVFYRPHYGMPDSHSVAIGCQWVPQDSNAILLTAPGEPLFVIKAVNGGRNTIKLCGGELILMPHGLGVITSGTLELYYHADHLELNKVFFKKGESLKGIPRCGIRRGANGLERLISDILMQCRGRIVTRLDPIQSFPSRL